MQQKGFVHSSYRLPEELNSELEELADKLYKSKNQIIIEAIIEYLKQYN